MSSISVELEHIIGRLPGAVSACLMGLDGLPVETADQESLEPEGVDLGALLVEFSSVLGQLVRTGDVFASGAVEELTVKSDRLTTVLRPITPEYFVAVSLRPWASSGKARYLLRVHGSRLVDVIS